MLQEAVTKLSGKLPREESIALPPRGEPIQFKRQTNSTLTIQVVQAQHVGTVS